MKVWSLRRRLDFHLKSYAYAGRIQRTSSDQLARRDDLDRSMARPLEMIMSQDEAQRCLACERGSDVTPLIRLEYRGEPHWICPEHLPVLIHDPGRLVGRLAGAEHLRPAEHHD